VKLKALGKHLLIELYSCDRKLLNDASYIEKVMTEAADISGATIVQTVFHTFNPYGVSGIVVIAESHLAIHTWPEYGYAAVDVFTCGDDIDPYISYEYIKKKLKARNAYLSEIKRGLLDTPAFSKKVIHKALAGEE
jgi:S-adenosylmethionine decarboxylase proenzyme